MAKTGYDPFFVLPLAFILIVLVVGVFGLIILNVNINTERRHYDDFCTAHGYDYANDKPHEIHRIQNKEFITCVTKNVNIDNEGRVEIDRFQDVLVYSEKGD